MKQRQIKWGEAERRGNKETGKDKDAVVLVGGLYAKLS